MLEDHQESESEDGRDERGTEQSEPLNTEKWFEECALNLFRYCDFKSFEEVGRITITEYNLLMKAVELKGVDMDYRAHQIAYLTFVAKGQKRSGKNKTRPVYPKFEKFFDYEREVNRVLGITKKSRFEGIGALIGGESDG